MMNEQAELRVSNLTAKGKEIGEFIFLAKISLFAILSLKRY